MSFAVLFRHTKTQMECEFRRKNQRQSPIQKKEDETVKWHETEVL